MGGGGAGTPWSQLLGGGLLGGVWECPPPRETSTWAPVKSGTLGALGLLCLSFPMCKIRVWQVWGDLGSRNSVMVDSVCPGLSWAEEEDGVSAASSGC